MANPSHKPPMLVIGAVANDVKSALSSYFDLVEYVMEGPGAKPAAGITRDVRAVLTRAVLGLPLDVMDAMPNLELVLSFGAGGELIDFPEAARRGIQVVHTPDELTEDVADYAITMILAMRRQLLQADALVRQGRWSAQPAPVTRRVAGARVGIVGLGRIGARIARKATALDMEVHYHARHARSDVSFPYHPDVAELARAVDILVLACAGTADTHHLVDANILDALGPDGTLINVARGSVVDESALITALQEGHIKGAALDVFASEPVPDPRFSQLANVLLSPHAASFTREARADAIARLVTGATAYLETQDAGRVG